MLMSLLKGIGENITIGKKHSMKNSLTCSPLKVSVTLILSPIFPLLW